jgi:MFS family permease
MSSAAAIVPGVATEPLFRRIAPLFAAMFLGFLTVSLPLPVLAVYVGGQLGFGTAIAGLSVGIQSFATILTRPAAGRMVDDLGAKITLVRGLVTSAAAGCIYLASTLVAQQAVSLGILLVGRLTLGAGESMLITGVLSWAIMRAGPGRSGRAISWNGMAQYGALALGAPIGFAVYSAFGFVATAACAAVMPLLALGVVLPLAATPRLGGTRLPLGHVIGRIWQPGVGLMLAGIGFAAVSTFASLDFVERGWTGAGYALFAYGACFVAVRVFAGGLPDRFGGAAVAAASMAVETVGQCLLWLAPTPLVALVGAGLTGAGCSLIFPALGIEALRRVPAENRGIAVGAFAAFQDLAIGATGPALGAVAAVHTPAAVFLAGAVAAAMGVVAAARLRRPPPGIDLSY